MPRLSTHITLCHSLYELVLESVLSYFQVFVADRAAIFVALFSEYYVPM
jgi:hypothetical protein